MKWRTYPAYRGSGVEWLGEIPEHWETKHLKYTFLILNGSTPKSNEQDYWDGDIPWATPDDLGSLNSDTLNTTHRMITQEGYDSCGTSLAPVGSLILSTRAPIGHLALAGTSLCTNQGCRSLVFRADAEKRFYYYQLLTAKQELGSWGRGSTFRELSRDKLACIFLATPSFREQRVIVSFLDRETSRIDELIAKKQCQIELLQEKRSALISHVVTKGLDPDVRMKDSGVEWLGEIPEHWEIVKLKRVASLKSGENITAEETEDDGQYPVYGGNGLRGFSDRYTHDGEFVLIGRQGALCGNINYAEGKFWASEHAVVVTARRPIVLRWMGELLRTMNLNQYSLSAAQPGIAVDRIRELSIPFPSFSEQSMIASFLDQEISVLDDLIERINHSIRLLREYRTALISAAVTGKIDVRQEVA